MQVRRPAAFAAGGLCAAVLALAAVLPAAASSTLGPAPAEPVGSSLLLVRHAGTEPVTVDTTRLTGPALRAYWTDAFGDRTVDAGSVQRDTAVELYPPDTGDGAAHDWTVLIVDATRGLVPPA
jgi:hypothetical protein